MNAYLIIENAGHEDERTVYSTASYREAMIWIYQNYTDEEFKQLNVTLYHRANFTF